ncbi:hypothetical protein [Vagococcus fluvialis]|uniref:Resolvase/invertase-type recombinase catalytic domain-containing protein n=1 Tax=Vagococcus fluvialis TaxID=2738 RepID=A0A7X6DAA3_9ENTE|nr:hypothetical protein [Vagococcus fluvialis]NKC68533.1 hypothetical protein [Vagococcus fluvialis]
MRKIGFINKRMNDINLKKQIDKMSSLGIKNIIFDEKELMNLETNNELIVYEVKSFEETVSNLQCLFLFFKKKNIKLTILSSEDIFSNLPNTYLFDIVNVLSETDYYVSSVRTKRGIKYSQNKGKKIGRPSISKELEFKIKNLYFEKKLSLKEISLSCGVSLATVYKYVRLSKII